MSTQHRLAELMAKDQATGLTADEREELVRLVDAPVLDPHAYDPHVLDPPADAPADFMSQHDFDRSDVAARLGRIRWFARCGQPVELHLTMPVEQVSSWAQAMEAIASPEWEAAQLAAQNQLGDWLQLNDPGSYGKWNELVSRHKERVVDPLTGRVLVPFQHEHGVGAALVHSVQWDVLGALMENAYLGSGHRCFFFLELLWVYESGHFPCGWRGAWPDGTLLVY